MHRPANPDTHSAAWKHGVQKSTSTRRRIIDPIPQSDSAQKLDATPKRAVFTPIPACPKYRARYSLGEAPNWGPFTPISCPKYQTVDTKTPVTPAAIPA